MKQLVSKLPQQFFVHPTEARLLDVLIKIHIEEFEHNDKVPPKVEAVEHFDDSILIRVFSQDTCEQLSLDTRIICLLFLILAQFYRDGTTTISHVDCSDNLAKGSCINDLLNLVPIAYLLSDTSVVETISL